MKIIDKNGAEIVIEDIDLAIANAEFYMNYHGQYMIFSKIHLRFYEYWQDIYKKLTAAN